MINAWLSEDRIDEHDLAGRRSSADRALRAMDLLLAIPLAALLALPLWCLRTRAVAQTLRGQGGRPFERMHLRLGPGAAGRVLGWLGAAHWPTVVHVLRGEMAWVGPRPRALDEAASPEAALVRPGVVNPWFIRQRTAVHFGTEAQADLQYLAGRGLAHDAGLLLRGMLVALLPPPPAQTPRRVQVGDVWFDNLDMGESLQRLRDLLDSGQASQVSFVNPACVNIAAGHRGYRRALARAALVLPDGIGIKIGSLLLGKPLKQNVNGTDLFPRLCDMLQARGSSVFLLGGQPGVADAVAGEIARRWPALTIAGSRHGYFSALEEGDVAAQVRASGAEVLLVARGVPSQDLFIDRYLPLLGARVALGVGGLFDFVSGRISRAPMWMRETGLEWIWRLMQEPGRMWRRYLVGNFTFLARMALQRVGLRRPAADAVVEPPRQPAPMPAVRAFVFATDLASADLPLPAQTPVALLPVGHQTVIEHLMEQLAQAGVADVDIVVAEQPEQLRELLDDGGRWGLHLRWHLAKDPARTYGVLASAARAAARRVLVLHADRMPSAAALVQLAECEQFELHAPGDGALRWSGWASATPAQLEHLPADLDRAGLEAALQAMNLRALLREPQDEGSLSSPACVLDAQRRALSPAGLRQVPGSWISMPWGAMSPLARVDAGAAMTGPVLVGPGCWVQRGASVGPGVVLSRDAVVSTGTQVQDSLVMPRTYIGTGLEVSNAIVNAARVRHVGLGVETTLSPSDALVMDLSGEALRRAGAFGRAAAAAVVLVCAPLLLAHVAARRAGGRAPAWSRRRVVVGRDATTRRPQLALLHCPRPDATPRDRAWAALAALVDVVAGRRCWFGMRPRSLGQWYALRPEWQDILSTSPVGVLHAPSWSGDFDDAAETQAAADVFGSTLSQPAGLWLQLAALRSRTRDAQPAPLVSRVAPALPRGG